MTSENNKEWTLSDKIGHACAISICSGDVKEFIKRLKEMNFGKRRFRIINEIDKLAGKSLVEEIN